LEQAEAQKDVTRCQAAILREVDALNTFTGDWSNWDDTYDFAQGKMPDYVERNFTDELYTGSNLDLVLIYDLKGNRLAGSIYHPEAEEFIQLGRFPEKMAEDDVLLHASDAMEGQKGIIQTSMGPMMIASRPVLTNEVKGPAVGSLMMGRVLNAARTNRLSAQTAVSLTVWNLQSGAMPQEKLDIAAELLSDDAVRIHVASDDHLDGYKALRDLKGDPLLLMRAELPRDISKRGHSVVLFANAVAIGGSAVMLIALLGLLRGTVVHPILRIAEETATIEKSGDLSKRIGLRRKDELGQLSQQFNSLLATIEENSAHLTTTNHLLEAEIQQREEIDQALRKANEQLEALASTDELTGLANRRSLMSLLKHDFERGRRDGTPLSLAIIDVDNLKQLNDELGHVFGDTALRAVALAMTEAARASDILARYAGDEYVLLMPNTNSEHAVKAANRLRQAVNELDLGTDAHGIKTTVSIGVHTAVPSADDSAEALLRLADKALYQAKQTRNTVCVYRDETP